MPDRDPEIWTFTYDARGRWVSTYRHRDDTVFEWCKYDDGDRLTNCVRGDPIELLRDAQHRIVSVRDVQLPDSPTTIRYDARGDLVEVVDHANGVAGSASSFEYDAAHRLVREASRLGEADMRVDMNWRYRYDAMGRLAEIEQRWEGTDTVRRTTFTYDGIGRMALITSGDETLTFEYDARGRLVGDVARRGDQKATTRYEYTCPAVPRAPD